MIPSRTSRSRRNKLKKWFRGASNRGVGPNPEGRRTIRQYKPYLGCQKQCRTEHWTKVEKGVGPSVATVHNVAASDWGGRSVRPIVTLSDGLQKGSREEIGALDWSNIGCRTIRYKDAPNSLVTVSVDIGAVVRHRTEGIGSTAIHGTIRRCIELPVEPQRLCLPFGAINMIPTDKRRGVELNEDLLCELRFISSCSSHQSA
jgi:hypothetical protein